MTAKPCAICQNELSASDASMSLSTGVSACMDCRYCLKCGNVVSGAEIKALIQAGSKIQHVRCVIASMAKFTLVSVTQAELDMLNLCRLMVTPDVEDLSVDTNKARAEKAGNQVWESLSMEQKYTHVQMLEAVYGNAYALLKKDPESLKKAHLEKDRERVFSAREKAEKSTVAIELKDKAMKKEAKESLSAQQKFIAGFKGTLSDEAMKAIWTSQGKEWK